MRSIIGLSKRPIPLALAKEGFDETVSREPDMSRFMDAGEGWLSPPLLTQKSGLNVPPPMESNSAASLCLNMEKEKAPGAYAHDAFALRIAVYA